jgi:S1-C subfamily serine protease
VTALADRPGPLTLMPSATQLSATTATGPPMPGYGAYLGTVPDMTDNPGGVRLLGVRAGSPAEKAGLRGDDIITRIGDTSVTDLEAMTQALRSHHPGDTVSVVVRRGNQTTTLQAVLGERGG